MSFSCIVCYEPRSTRLALPKLQTGNGDVLRSADCEHPVCQACMAAFVASRVEEQRVFNVRCPSIGCTAELFEQDVTRLSQLGLLDGTVCNRFAELRARDFSARAQVFSQDLMAQTVEDNDFDLVLQLWKTTRLCPRCSLVIERSSGCNSFYCICGHHFDYMSAPRLVGNGVKNYGKVIRMAKHCGLPLMEAEKFGGDAKQWINVSRIAAKTLLPYDEALKLHLQAMGGDAAAIEQIRKSRRITEATQEEMEWEPLQGLWDSAPERAEEKHAADEHRAEDEIALVQGDGADLSISAIDDKVEDLCEAILCLVGQNSTEDCSNDCHVTMLVDGLLGCNALGDP